jgi:hypothetical protein
LQKELILSHEQYGFWDFGNFWCFLGVKVSKKSNKQKQLSEETKATKRGSKQKQTK